MKSRIIILSLISLLFFSCTSEAQKTKLKRTSPDGRIIVADDATMSSVDGPAPLTPRTDSLFRIVINKGKEQNLEQLPIGKRVVGYGKLLLGVPYVDKTLEVNPYSESLVCNLEGLDCVTFFENAWAFALAVKAPIESQQLSFRNALINSRYRNGQLDGYASRLHYTTDYFYNNAQRGKLKEMTTSIGGIYAVIEDKPIDFMSNHPASYKQIENNETEWKRIEFYEREMANRGGFYYIKKENVAKIEKGIQDGDLIGITTSIPGIDCSHTGIAVRGDDGRIHLMHASLTKKKVIISDEPLADYLAGNAKQTGIIVYRPLEVEQK